MTDDPSVDVEQYAPWFAWARDALQREVDATHAAAEAAYRVMTAGGTSEQARVAAEGAGAGPSQLDAETMALAEWATWARFTFGASMETGLAIGRQAMSEVDATHDLDAAIRNASTSLAGQRATTSRSASGGRGGWIAAAVIAAIVLISLAAAGLMSGANQSSGNRSEPPAAVVTLDVSVEPSSGLGVVTASGLPPNTNVYIFVGDTWEKVVLTDSTGFLTAKVDIPRGGTPVSVCLDSIQQQCPATKFVTRS